MIATVILAGGKGQRMGGNKPLCPYRGSTLIETVIARLRPQTDRLLINAGVKAHPRCEALARLGLPLIYDTDLHDLGPLSGVHAALRVADEQSWTGIVTVPCDMPALPNDYVARLMEAPKADIVFYGVERDYPLCALWRTSVRTSLCEALNASRPHGGLSVRRFLSSLSTARVAVSDARAFHNINRPEDIAEAA